MDRRWLGVPARNVSWSPDGQWLLFTSTASGNRDVYAVSVDGAELRQLTTEPTQDAHGLWSADGKYVVYLSDHQIVSIIPFDGDTASVVFDIVIFAVAQTAL